MNNIMKYKVKNEKNGEVSLEVKSEFKVYGTPGIIATFLVTLEDIRKIVERLENIRVTAIK